MQEEYQNILNKIDKQEKLTLLYDQDFLHYIGSIAINMEIIANEVIIDIIKDQDPDSFIDSEADSETLINESYEQIKVSFIKAIESKKQAILSSYAVQKYRQDLLNG